MLLLFSARSPCPLLRSSGPEPTRPWQLRAARVVAPHCGPLKGPSGAGRSSGSEYRAVAGRVCCSRNKSKHSTHTPARLQLLLVVFPPGIQVVDLKGEAILLIAMVASGTTPTATTATCGQGAGACGGGQLRVRPLPCGGVAVATELRAGRMRRCGRRGRVRGVRCLGTSPAPCGSVEWALGAGK